MAPSLKTNRKHEAVTTECTAGAWAGKEQVDCHPPDLQGWQMRKEVISHKEAHEDPVINTPLKIEGEGQAGHGELSFQILQHEHGRKGTSANTAN